MGMGQKLGRMGVPFFLTVARSPSNTKSPGPRSTRIPSGILVHPAVCYNGHWPKIAGLCPFRGREARSPSNTMPRKPRHTSVPSGILMHPTVWPQKNGPKIGGSAPFLVVCAKAYLRITWNLDPSNRLATVHERYRQTGQTDRQDNGPIA